MGNPINKPCGGYLPTMWMLETGQPLHAFDEIKASSESIKVEGAENAEKFRNFE